MSDSYLFCILTLGLPKKLHCISQENKGLYTEVVCEMGSVLKVLKELHNVPYVRITIRDSHLLTIGQELDETLTFISTYDIEGFIHNIEKQHELYQLYKLNQLLES